MSLSFCMSVYIGISLISTKPPPITFIGIALNLYISLGRTEILTLLNFIIYENGISFHFGGL